MQENKQNNSNYSRDFDRSQKFFNKYGVFLTEIETSQSFYIEENFEYFDKKTNIMPSLKQSIDTYNFPTSPIMCKPWNLAKNYEEILKNQIYYIIEKMLNKQTKT